MTWIMFLWLAGRTSSLTVTSQEFNTRTACVNAATVLQKEFAGDFRFVCLEKGDPKGEKNYGSNKAKRSH